MAVYQEGAFGLNSVCNRLKHAGIAWVSFRNLTNVLLPKQVVDSKMSIVSSSVQEAKGFQGCFMLEVRALGIVMTAQVLLMFGIRSGNSDLLVFFSNGSNLNAINNNDHPEILSRGWATSRFLIYFGKKEETALSATLRKRLQIGCSLIFSRAVVISFCMFYLANYL
ncbi:hypothetical protein SELMODRAFT_415097 [Selaginella moellendorffii]|uniref:Uncharacterized protein n=1 Tax=Selaginella moellendorffii TaxID=88036 RepID=D8RV04_SELML|nr:hypothetical protein SELMODRAFT_415097 [Selaginella moellendorffii]